MGFNTGYAGGDQIAAPKTRADVEDSNPALGSLVHVTNEYGKILVGNGTDFVEYSPVKSDPVPPDVRQITTTQQFVYTKCRIKSITLLSGTLTSLVLRDGLVQTYTDTNTTDTIKYQTTSLTIGEKITIPVDFYFGVHATIAGTSPVVSVEIETL